MNRHERLTIIEDPPPATRPRWYCHGLPGHDDIDAAVAAALERAESVLVRTLGDRFYWAGVDPHDPTMRPWPPSPSERQAIDDEYARQVGEEARLADLARAYEAERDRWLRERELGLAAREPTFECQLNGPHVEPGWIVYHELDVDGRVCAAYHSEGAMGFGSCREALAGARGCAVDDPWIVAAERAIGRRFGPPTAEQLGTASGLPPDDPGLRAAVADMARHPSWRRTLLWVGLGVGERLHVSPSRNRASIADHGLDWRRMRGSGIAGSGWAEAEAIFLCAGEPDFFVEMAREPCDVWSVRVDGLWLEGDPGSSGGGDDDWVIVPEPIGADRVRLAEADAGAGRQRERR